MKKFAVRRLASAIITLFVVASALFILFRLMPGDPTAVVESPALDESVRASMAEQYGIDEPLHIQYIKYIRNVITLQFGQSFFNNEPVRDIILRRAVNTFALMGPAYVIAYLVGVFAGAYGGWNRGSRSDTVIFSVGIFVRSIPIFLMGLLLLYLFAFKLELFPIGGMFNPSNTYTSEVDMFVSLDFLYHVILPVVSVVPFLMSSPLLLMRTNILKTKGEDYIKMSRARGIRERDVFTKHAMRNSILPIVTAIPLSMGYAISGNVLIEVIYSWPGLGRTLVRAVYTQDYPLAQGAFVVIALVVIFGNLMADLAYAALDPRITYGEES